jgi:hypothetical protein
MWAVAGAILCDWSRGVFQRSRRKIANGEVRRAQRSYWRGNARGSGQ